MTEIEKNIVESEKEQEKEAKKTERQVRNLLFLYTGFSFDIPKIVIDIDNVVSDLVNKNFRNIESYSKESVKIIEKLLDIRLDSSKVLEAYFKQRVGKDGIEFNLYERINIHRQTLKRELIQKMLLGTNQRIGINNIVKLGADRFDVFASSMKRLTSDTVHKVYLQAFEMGLNERAVSPDVVTNKVFTYRTQLDKQVRETHVRLEGTTYTEQELRKQGLPNELYDIGCRCSLV